jgi:protein-tyrosine-phosphatase
MENEKEKFKVLFVCTGNSCRSPMAEGILKKMLKERGVDNIEVSSAGTYSLDGAPPSLFAVEVAKTRNVDLTQNRSRQLTKQVLKKADLILVMSDAHLEHIRKLDEEALKKTHLLKTFPENDSTQKGEHPVVSNEDKIRDVLYIKDPIGGSMDDYNQCFLEIEKEIRRILPELISLTDKKNFKNRSSQC